MDGRSIPCAEQFLCHYVHYLGHPTDQQWKFGDEHRGHVRILAFDVPGLSRPIYASLGLCCHAGVLGRAAEVMTLGDRNRPVVPSILGRLLLSLTREQQRFGWGTVVDGIAAIDPAFSATYRKTALYVTGAPHYTGVTGLAPELFALSEDEASGTLYVGIFISPAEHDFIHDRGSWPFEERLELLRIDPFDLRRPSVV